MNLQQFLSSSTDSSFWQNQSVCAFVYKDEERYPVSFFTHVRKSAEKHGALPVQPLHVEQGLSTVYGQLETSFLGSSWCYSLACGSLDTRDKRALFAYAQTYQGPHKLMLFVAREQAQDLKELTAISLDEQLDEALCLKLAAFLGHTLSLNAQRLVHRIFKDQQRVYLSSALMILEYVTLIDASLEGDENKSLTFDAESSRQKVLVEDAFFKEMRGLLKSDSSLFTLSQLFFAKRPEAFYRYLATIESAYPDQFWISFWTEQLYRAFFYITFMKKGNISEAKKVGTRLPFSFLQKDWRLHETSHLVRSHAFLYELDSALKNSRGELGFDIFYNNFFKK